MQYDVKMGKSTIFLLTVILSILDWSDLHYRSIHCTDGEADMFIGIKLQQFESLCHYYEGLHKNINKSNEV
jgi:hypothetical protein